MSFVGKYVLKVREIWSGILVFWLFILIFGLIRGPNLLVNTDNFVPETGGTLSAETNALMREYFPLDEKTVPWAIVIQCPKDSTSTYPDDDLFESPSGLANVKGCNGEADAVINQDIKSLLDRVLEEIYPAHPDVFIKELTVSYFSVIGLDMEPLKYKLVSADGRTTLVQLLSTTDIAQAVRMKAYPKLRSLVSKYKHQYCPTCYIGVTGADTLFYDVTDGLAKLLIKTNIFIMPLAFALIVYMVRSWRLMVITGFNVGCVVLGAFAMSDFIAEYTMRPQSITPQMIEVLSIAITIDYSLFLFTRFYDELDNKRKRWIIRRQAYLQAQRHIRKQNDMHVASLAYIPSSSSPTGLVDSQYQSFDKPAIIAPSISPNQSSHSGFASPALSFGSDASFSQQPALGGQQDIHEGGRYTSLQRSSSGDSLVSTLSTVSLMEEDIIAPDFDPTHDSEYDPKPDVENPAMELVISALIETMKFSGHVVVMSGSTLLLSFIGFFMTKCPFLILPAMFTAIGVLLSILASLTTTCAFIFAYPTFFVDFNWLPKFCYGFSCISSRCRRRPTVFEIDYENIEYFNEEEYSGKSSTPGDTSSDAPAAAGTGSFSLNSTGPEPLHHHTGGDDAFDHDNSFDSSYLQQISDRAPQVTTQTLAVTHGSTTPQKVQRKKGKSSKGVISNKYSISQTHDGAIDSHLLNVHSLTSDEIDADNKHKQRQQNTVVDLVSFRKSIWYRLGNYFVKRPYNIIILVVFYSVFIAISTQLYHMNLSSAFALGIPRDAPSLYAMNTLQANFLPGLLQPFFLYLKYSPKEPVTNPAFSQKVLDNANQVITKLFDATDISPKHIQTPFYYDGKPVLTEEQLRQLYNDHSFYRFLWLTALSHPDAEPDKPTTIPAVVQLQINLPISPDSSKVVDFIDNVRKNVLLDANKIDADEIHWYLGGYKATEADTIDVTQKTFPWMLAVTSLVVIALVAVLFKSFFVPIRLLLTIVLPLTATFGLAVLVYQHGILNWLHIAPLEQTKLQAFYWYVPIFSALVLLSLALDYDIFLISRVIEYRENGFTNESSILLALYNTGPIINAAGIVMALTFSTLMLMKSDAVNQLGYLLVTSVLTDTFIVRPIIVPCVMQFADRIAWLPRKVPMVNLKHYDGTIVNPQRDDEADPEDHHPLDFDDGNDHHYVPPNADNLHGLGSEDADQPQPRVIRGKSKKSQHDDDTNSRLHRLNAGDDGDSTHGNESAIL